MTDEAINIAVAKACGWIVMADGRCFNKTSMLDDDSCMCDSLPNYTGNLNAMHEAEKVLGEKRIRSYAFTLAQILNTSPTVDLDDQFLNIHATAATRAEAFLRTLNLWTD